MKKKGGIDKSLAKQVVGQVAAEVLKRTTVILAILIALTIYLWLKVG